MRGALETSAAAMAAERRTEDDLRRLEDLLGPAGRPPGSQETATPSSTRTPPSTARWWRRPATRSWPSCTPTSAR
ncbi:hypothetical protein [Actinomadura madurae]